MYMFLCARMFSVLLGIDPGMEFLGHNNDFMFNSLRNCQTVFHNGYTTSHPHQQGMRVLFPLHPHQHLLFFGFLILIGVKWYLIMVLCSISVFFLANQFYFILFIYFLTSLLEYNHFTMLC